MKKIILTLIFLISSSLYSNNFYFNIGGTYTQTLENKIEYSGVTSGTGLFLTFAKDSGISIDYSFLYQIELIAVNPIKTYSSMVQIAYRNYFFTKAPSRRSMRVLFPYFAISHNSLFYNHQIYAPGFELTIGLDFILKFRYALPEPLTAISYALSYIFKAKQLISIKIYGAIHLMDNHWLVNTGAKFSTGMAF